MDKELKQIFNEALHEAEKLSLAELSFKQENLIKSLKTIREKEK